MNTLLSAFGDWLAKNWIIIVLIVLAVALLVPTYLRQKKEVTARNELNNSIKKGTKIITTAGVYGIVESIEETTDGKVVTIVTGSSKNPTTMTIHINAIGGIDNKKSVVGEDKDKVQENKKIETETSTETKEETESKDNKETVEEVKTSNKKPTTKKSSTKKSSK